jgi:hypothetical protein
MPRNLNSRLTKLEALNSPTLPPSRVHLIAAIDDDGEAERAALIADGRAQANDIFIFLVPLRPTDREAA